MGTVDTLTQYENEHIGERQRLPERYLGLSVEEMDRRIAAARATLGKRLVVLGHHYQRDEVIKFADYTGDSWKLSKRISQHQDAEFIIFCGVHFMAESADILASPHQRVILPDLAAGCSMADMADPEQLEMAWKDLEAVGVASTVVPVTYINSAASIKAFVGEHGGVVCTSGNAKATLEWSWARGEKIIFLPDQHLGRNTAYKMGVPLDLMPVWDPHEPFGGLDAETIKKARMLLWKGYCSVHTRFSVRQIENVRKQYPTAKVIVHPECTWDVVQAADEAGSTEHILKTVRESPPGSVWAIGTEVHLVNRLAHEVAPDRTVLTLDQFGCLCSTMFRVSPNHLLWIMEELVAGRVHNVVKVPDRVKHWSKVALDRMLTIM
jgi:quinolinate synthase